MTIEQYLLLNDQPVTCPACGSRTEFTETDNEPLIQHHVCNGCGGHFLAIEDDEL